MQGVYGDKLLELCRSAREVVFIVAPFVKDAVLARVLDVLPSTVRRVTCVTRWIPEEIAAGVSDLEIFDRLTNHDNAELLLHPHLHAKLYRADHRCLVGSANLTGRALGWSSPPNLELLIELDANIPELGAFENNLLSVAIPANVVLRNAMRAAADLLLQENRVPRFGVTDIDYPGSAAPRTWLPKCSTPDRLWNVYANQELWRLVASAVEAAKLDLVTLSPPAGLPRITFDLYVSAILKQMPLVMDIDRRTAAGLTDDEAAAVIAEAVSADELPYHPIFMWEVLKSWLSYFFPGTYRRTSQGEVFIRGREIL